MSTTKVVTPKAHPVRFSYAHVFEPQAMDGSEPKYSTNVLIPKTDTVTVNMINAAVEAAKAQGKSSKWDGKIPSHLKTPLRDGDIERPDDETYHGMWFLNASSKMKPGVVGPDAEPLMDRSEFYSGCHGRVSLNFYPFSAKGNKGVGAGLNNVQKLEDGEALSGGSSAQEDFGDGADDLM